MTHVIYMTYDVYFYVYFVCPYACYIYNVQSFTLYLAGGIVKNMSSSIFLEVYANSVCFKLFTINSSLTDNQLSSFRFGYMWSCVLSYFQSHIFTY